ncbi:MAG: gliding motility protein GldM [Bacteroidota bacterium]|nr:gliding motility protein GldM [Bacteroidota bacterium]
MALPKEPRQKMINLMYLVLTALLALNVSSEILNAFKTVNNSLNNATDIIERKNVDLFKSFKAKLEKPESKEKAQEWLPRAEKAKELADNLNSYLDNLKTELKKEAGLEMRDGVESYKEDNLEAATRLFVEDPPTGKGKGKELYQRLKDFKEQILAIHPDIQKDLGNALPLDLTIPKSTGTVANNNWEYGYFHMTPTIAAITILSKFQNDVKNSESQVIEYCHKKIGEVEVVYDAFQALVGQSSEYLMPGQELKITGGVGAYSNAAKPTVMVDGAVVPLTASGTAEYKTIVGSPGTYTKKVTISYKKPDGQIASVNQEIKYTVGSPTGVFVSAEAVKALYVGLPNPIRISGGSKGAEAINASIDNGSLKNNGGGSFTAEPESPGKAVIAVTVDGKTTPFEFKVKRIPDPTPMIGQFGGGSVPANAFKANVGVRADLRDFVFEGVNFTVTGFTIVCTGKGFESTGPKYAVVRGAYFSPEAKQYIEMCRPGSSVNITDITVAEPNGNTRKLASSMAFNLTN